MRGWMLSASLASTVLAIALGVVATRAPEADDRYDAEADPCFRYGRFECCMRPDEP